MKLLKEILNELWGSGRERTAEFEWRDQAEQRGKQFAADKTDTSKEWWIVTPSKRKYGPFPNYDRAVSFYNNRKDIDRKSELKAIPIGGRI